MFNSYNQWLAVQEGFSTITIKYVGISYAFYYPISFSFALILTFFPVCNHPPFSIVYCVCHSVFCCNLFNNLFCYLSLYILQLFTRHLSLPLLTVYGMRSMVTTKLALSELRSGTLYGGDCGGVGVVLLGGFTARLWGWK